MWHDCLQAHTLKHQILAEQERTSDCATTLSLASSLVYVCGLRRSPRVLLSSVAHWPGSKWAVKDAEPEGNTAHMPHCSVSCQGRVSFSRTVHFVAELAFVVTCKSLLGNQPIPCRHYRHTTFSHGESTSKFQCGDPDALHFHPLASAFSLSSGCLGIARESEPSITFARETRKSKFVAACLRVAPSLSLLKGDLPRVGCAPPKYVAKRGHDSTAYSCVRT